MSQRILRILGLVAALGVLVFAALLLSGDPLQAEPQARPLLQSSDTYTITVLDGAAVTMGDATGTIPILVANDPASSDSIDYVKLWFDATFYDVSGGSDVPAGWQITQVKNAGKGQTFIVFETSTAPIAPGESLTFNVVVAGDSGANIPSAGTDQTTDQLEDSEVKAGSTTFDDPPSLPSWLRRGLSVSIVAIPPSVAVGELITVTMVVDNRSTVSQSNITRTLTFTPTGMVTLTNGPIPITLTLSSGESEVVTHTYQAATEGRLQ
jgi:hypothetical protein